jgi:3-oxoacyl-[acyl-carrier-protein] synthase II
MAVWTPYGRGADAFWKGLITMQPGRKEIARYDMSHWVFRSKAAAVIPEIPGDPGAAEMYSAHLMGDVVSDLLDDLGAAPEDLSPYDVGVCLGSSHGGATARFLDFLKVQRGGDDEASLKPSASGARFSSAAFLNDLTEELGAKGPSALISTACASGTSSIGTGYDWIRQGRARRVFAGGYGYFSDISLTGFNILRLVGKSGCRPFSADRDGMMLGDGFALVTLEDEDMARQRNANMIARVLGYCAVNEAYHPTSPDPEGETGTRVMWNALGQSEERLASLDYINAHGTGTEANDKAELNAIRRLLAKRRASSSVAVSSTKGHHGHSLGATGSVEFIATLLALRNNCVPATLGLDNPEPGFEDVDLVRTPRNQQVRIALSNSFAFGGNVAAIAIERVD